MIDRTTKVLLLLIALGLWADVAERLLRPAHAAAQDFSTMERYLRNIESKVGDIESDVDDIEDGTCKNKKLCTGPAF
jgi:hypothetical protein